VIEYIFVGFLVSLPILSILLALTIIAPSWHWAAGFITIVAAWFAFRWTMHLIAIRAPGYKENIDVTLGTITFSVLTIGFMIAVAIYSAGLIWWKSKN
jgi:hypothetical protein